MPTSVNTTVLKFTVRGEQESLVLTKTGVTADSLLRVLQLLRDKSPDKEVRSGAYLMVKIIAETLKQSRFTGATAKMTLSFKWLEEMAFRANQYATPRSQNSVWFMAAFVKEITPPKEKPDATH